MKILGIEHVGIAVESLDESSPFWREVLEFPTGLRRPLNQKVWLPTSTILGAEKWSFCPH